LIHRLLCSADSASAHLLAADTRNVMCFACRLDVLFLRLFATVAVKAMIAGKPPPSGPSPLPSNTREIFQMSAKSPSHGQCLNVLAGGKADGTPIFTYPCGKATQSMLMMGDEGMSPSVAGLEFVAGRQRGGAGATGLDNDQWDTTGGLLKCLGKCATAEPDGSVALYSCNGSAAQTWSTEWPVIKSGSSCLGLAAKGPPSFPNNKLAKVSACATSDPTQSWTNSSASGAFIDVMPEPAFVRVCGRISAFKPDGTPPQGYCLIVDSNSTWFLAVGGAKGQNGRDKPNVLATGQLPPAVEVTAASGSSRVAVSVSAWRTLSLEMAGSKITPSVDGKSLGTVVSDTLPHGMAALGSGWHRAVFDDFSLKPA
jgi:hypothetical protein